MSCDSSAWQACCRNPLPVGSGCMTYSGTTRSRGRANFPMMCERPGLMDFYLRSADAAVRLLYPNVLRMPLPDATEASRAVSFASEDTALAWLDIERANLLEAVARAAELGVPAHAWRLVDSLRGYLLTRGYNAEGLAACPAALDAARTESDLRAEASILDVLGLLYYNLSEYERAKQAHTAALERSREVGDRATEAHSLHNLGRVYSQLERPAEAGKHYATAMNIRRELHDVAGEARSLNYLGASALSMADLDGAIGYATRALQLSRDTGDIDLEARALHLMALTLWARAARRRSRKVPGGVARRKVHRQSTPGPGGVRVHGRGGLRCGSFNES